MSGSECGVRCLRTSTVSSENDRTSVCYRDKNAWRGMPHDMAAGKRSSRRSVSSLRSFYQFLPCTLRSFYQFFRSFYKGLRLRVHARVTHKLLGHACVQRRYDMPTSRYQGMQSSLGPLVFPDYFGSLGARQGMLKKELKNRAECRSPICSNCWFLLSCP